MKILFWFGPRTALIVILSANMLLFPARARSIECEIEQQKEKSTIQQNVLDDLENKGLESETALQMASLMMKIDPTRLDRQCHNLCINPELGIDRTSLVKALSKRLLYRRNIDLEEYHALTGLVHDIKGHDLTQSQRQALLEVARLNRSI